MGGDSGVSQQEKKMANTQIFSEQIVNAVWNKAKIIPGQNPTEWRQDIAGAWIQRSKYGDRTSSFGWEIDHIRPVSRYGSDNLDNLRPLQWENNVSKCDDYPTWTSVVSSDGNRYLKYAQRWRIC